MRGNTPRRRVRHLRPPSDVAWIVSAVFVGIACWALLGYAISDAVRDLWNSILNAVLVIVEVSNQ